MSLLTKILNLFGPNEKAHKELNKVQSRSLFQELDVQKVVERSKDTYEGIRGYEIALATGGNKRGLN